MHDAQSYLERGGGAETPSLPVKEHIFRARTQQHACTQEKKTRLLRRDFPHQSNSNNSLRQQRRSRASRSRAALDPAPATRAAEKSSPAHCRRPSSSSENAGQWASWSVPNLGQVFDQRRGEGGGPPERSARDHGEQDRRRDTDVRSLLVVVLSGLAGEFMGGREGAGADGTADGGGALRWMRENDTDGWYDATGFLLRACGALGPMVKLARGPWVKACSSEQKKQIQVPPGIFIKVFRCHKTANAGVWLGILFGA